jgi:hypothetical protein
MGGFGSGRSSGSGRDKVEDCRLLDVFELSRAGCLTPRWSGAWQWIRDGETVAWINMHVDAGRLCLAYSVRVGGGEREDVTEMIRIVRVTCRFGGARPYFICPGVANRIACGRRVAKLHGAGRYFLCRHCYRLAYTSQSEDLMDRSLPARTRSERVSAAIREWPPRFLLGRRECGREPMSICASKLWTPRSARWRPTLHGFWRGPITRRRHGAFGHEPDQQQH